jgi:hypothetical protein
MVSVPRREILTRDNCHSHVLYRAAEVGGPIDPLYSLSGFFVGLLVGQTGMGGGALMNPLLKLTPAHKLASRRVVLSGSFFAPGLCRS